MKAAAANHPRQSPDGFSEETYQRNLAALIRLAPAYAGWLQTTPVHTACHAEVLPSPIDRPSVRITYQSGETAILYGVEDRFEDDVRTQPEAAPTAVRARVIFGLGLGDQVMALSSQDGPGPTCFVVEPDPGMARLALHYRDFVPLLADHQLVFVVPDREVLLQLATRLGRLYPFDGVQVIVDPVCRRYFDTDFAARITAFERKLKEQALYHGTWVHTAPRIVENEFINLAPALLSPAVDGLKDCLRGLPAVVVSAGPSLNRSLPLLTDLDGRAALLGAAPVLRSMAAYDIRPDLLAALDYGQSRFDSFQDVPDYLDIPLAFVQQADPRMVQGYRGPLVSVMQTRSPIRLWLGSHFMDREHWTVGANVGSLVLELAIFMGADPIILVGQDLSYPDLRSHAAGVVGGRDLSAQGSIHDRVLLESVDGSQVASSLLLASYLDEISAIVARTERTVINTSPSGARISGTLEMPLQEALDRFCRNGRVNIRETIRTHLGISAVDLGHIAGELDKLTRELKALNTIVSAALDLNRMLSERIDQIAARRLDPETIQLIRTHARYVAAMKQYGRTFEPLRVCLAGTESNLENGRERRPECPMPDRLRALLDRDRTRAEASRRASAHLQNLAAKVRPCLDGIMQARQQIRDHPDASFGYRNLAACLDEAGLAAEARQCDQTAIESAPEDRASLFEAAQRAARRQDFARVRIHLDRLSDLAPDHGPARDLRRAVDQAAETCLKRARTALGEGDWTTGVLSARRVLAWRPDHPEADRIQRDCLLIRHSIVLAVRNGE